MATRRQSKRAAARDRNEPAATEARAATAVPAESAQVPAVSTPASAAAASVPGRMQLASSLSIRSVGTVAGELRSALQSGSLRVDAGAVEQIDTAGLQLLVAAVAAASARNAPFEWLAVSGVVRDAAAHLGLANALRLPAAG